jgi:hypothetical protein
MCLDVYRKPARGTRVRGEKRTMFTYLAALFGVGLLLAVAVDANVGVVLAALAYIGMLIRIGAYLQSRPQSLRKDEVTREAEEILRSHTLGPGR